MSQQTDIRKPSAARNEPDPLQSLPFAGLFNGATERFRSRKWLLVVAATVLACFVAFAGLAWQAALAGLIVFALATALFPRIGLVNREDTAQGGLAAREGRKSSFSDILQALPQPAVLLSENGLIVAYNSQAREQWDNLRRGSHLSSAIRQPSLLDAVTGVTADGKPRTVNYTERVPVERRIEATVAVLPEARRAERGIACDGLIKTAAIDFHRI